MRPSLAHTRSVLVLTPSARAAAEIDTHGPSLRRGRPPSEYALAICGSPSGLEPFGHA